MDELKTGWYPGTSNHDHHRGLFKDCIGSSFVKTFADRSAAHAHETIVNPSDPTPTLTIGSAFHSLVAGATDEVRVVDKPKTAQQDGEIYQIHTSTYNSIMAMIDAMTHHPIAKKLMPIPDKEVTGIWHDVNNRLWCKIRPDAIDHERRIIVDWKSTADASYDAFNKDIAKFGYHVSAAWYKWGVKELTGHDYAFVAVAVEKSPPYGINCFNISGLAIKRAWTKIGECLGDMADAVQDDKWPNYPIRLWEADPPGWA
jgi:hypothetical protein